MVLFQQAEVAVVRLPQILADPSGSTLLRADAQQECFRSWSNLSPPIVLLPSALRPKWQGTASAANGPGPEPFEAGRSLPQSRRRTARATRSPKRRGQRGRAQAAKRSPSQRSGRAGCATLPARQRLVAAAELALSASNCAGRRAPGQGRRPWHSVRTRCGNAASARSAAPDRSTSSRRGATPSGVVGLWQHEKAQVAGIEQFAQRRLVAADRMVPHGGRPVTQEGVRPV